MRFWFLLLGALAVAPNVTAQLPTWHDLADRARWAANAHNVQSWRLEPVEGRSDQKRLVLEPTRLLPQTDPFHRQLTISLGAFLAVLEDEGAARGATVTWEALTSEPGALVSLAPGPGVAPPAFDALTAPTVKYRTRALALDPGLLASQQRRGTDRVRVTWLTETSEVAVAKTWAQRAFDLEMDLPRTRDESIVYSRYGEAARRESPWGITLNPNFTRGDLFWIESLVSLFPQSPVEYAKSAKDLLGTALKPVGQVLVLTSAGDSNRDRLETGRLLQRLWLEVRTQGGELLPLSQGLQEFDEMAALRGEAQARWARQGETVQMVLALFRPAPGEFLPSPRIPAAKILVP